MRYSKLAICVSAGVLVTALAAPSAYGEAQHGTPPPATRASAVDDWATVSEGVSETGQPGHGCGIRLDGTLWCWGQNSEGELGLGDTDPRYRPYQVGTASWQQVESIETTTCGLQSDGTLWCWGEDWGTTPQPVEGSTTWTQIAAGGDYFCGVQPDSTLWCWGGNELGQLGLGDFQAHPDPTEVGPGWQSVTAFRATTCGVKTNGKLWCWGDDEDGELGDDQAGYPWTAVPVHVLAGSTWSSVVEGFLYTCGVQTDNTLWCWGNNDAGNLGLGDSGGGTYRYVPNQVGADADWSTVTAGIYHTCGVRHGGELWCWGGNGYGELGLGHAGGHVDSPAQVGTKPVWAQPSSGGEDTCATRLNHTLWCWGQSDGGELGVGNRTKDTTVPVQVGPPNGHTPISDRLVSVSADSSTDVWAVGTQQRKGIVTTFVVHGDGSTWSREAALDPSKTNTTFTAVQALAPDDVWAVGSYRAGTTTYPLTEHWDGSTWTQVHAPRGRFTSAELDAIDAVGPDDIWAVGHMFEPFEYDENFIEHWDGTAWKVFYVPDRWATQLTGVVALSTRNVWAVGYGINDEEAGQLPVSYHWNGVAWKVIHPHHGDRFDDYYLRGVDATPSGDLWAAGDHEHAFGTEQTRIEHHDDAGWAVVGAPSPGVGKGTFVRGVSAVAVDDVWMVGDFENGTSSRFLTLNWDGSSWRQVDAPSPGGKSDTTGASVSAVAGDDVWAVGSWDNGVIARPYIEHWDGTAWSVALKGLPH